MCVIGSMAVVDGQLNNDLRIVGVVNRTYIRYTYSGRVYVIDSVTPMIDQNTKEIRVHSQHVEVAHEASTYVVFGEHAESGMPLNTSIWSAEVQAAVASIPTRPSIIAVDALDSGVFTSYTDVYFPAEDCNHFNVPGSVVRLLAADVPDISNNMDSSIDSQNAWNKVFDALSQVDPSFTTPIDQNVFARSELRKAYGIETVGAGISAFSAAVLYDAVSKRKESDGLLRLLQTPMTRREFLKFGAILLGGAALSWLRVPIFHNSLQTDVVDDTPTMLSIVANITKPILFNEHRLSMRNAKVGLSLIDYKQSTAQEDVSSAIIFGNLHKTAEFPGQFPGESPFESADRMLETLSSHLSDTIATIQRDHPDTPKPLVSIVLKKLFAEYSVYDFPQYDMTNTATKEWRWTQGNDHIIGPVERLIDMLLDQY